MTAHNGIADADVFDGLQAIGGRDQGAGWQQPTRRVRGEAGDKLVDRLQFLDRDGPDGGPGAVVGAEQIADAEVACAHPPRVREERVAGQSADGVAVNFKGDSGECTHSGLEPLQSSSSGSTAKLRRKSPNEAAMG